MRWLVEGHRIHSFNTLYVFVSLFSMHFLLHLYIYVRYCYSQSSFYIIFPHSVASMSCRCMLLSCLGTRISGQLLTMSRSINLRFPESGFKLILPLPLPFLLESSKAVEWQVYGLCTLCLGVVDLSLNICFCYQKNEHGHNITHVFTCSSKHS
ncbi:hypothetical protein QBC32DRAFT_159817 [Pseudoneurospora amorphoporcata]|uniref:Uncharacterized protein n=1 Tax=Pseudoneurospora amorphoporcata TaxID=241081 RepID=A0AAN6SFG3_9PEZI|nr:hypothetical protein QBC32DRAFT_159817 [Pseudoneurospora amorphoporcata]